MKILKKISWILVGIFASVTFIAMFIPFLIDLNRFKPEIQNFVSEEFNAKIDFASARLNIFGGLGLKFTDLTLETMEKPFVGEKIFTSKDADIRFDTLSLLRKKLVGRIDLLNPTLNIIKIGEKNNVLTLFKTPSVPAENTGNTANSSPTPIPKNFRLILDEFNVNNAHLIFKDLTRLRSPIVIDIKKLNLEMTSDGQTITIQKLNLNVFSGQLTSTLKIDMQKSPVLYSGDCDLKRISIEQVIQTLGSSKKDTSIHGIADVNFNFNGRGITSDVYTKALNAEGAFFIRDGEVKFNTSLPIILDQLDKFFSTLTIPGHIFDLTPNDKKKIKDSGIEVVSLKNMKGNFEIKNGMLYLKDNIPMQQGLLNTDITIGLYNSSLSGTVIFTATDAFTKELIATNSSFGYLLDKNGRFQIIVHLSGTVSQPEYTIETKNFVEILLMRFGNLLNPVTPLKMLLSPFQKIFE